MKIGGVYSRPEGEWYLFADQPIVDRYKRRERPWWSYVVLPRSAMEQQNVSGYVSSEQPNGSAA